MDEITKKKKINKKTMKDIYPISVNSQQCIGPCYYGDARIIHPLTLDEIKDVDHNFCPVSTFVYTDPRTKKSILSIIDKCVVPTARETQMDDILRDNVIAPQFHFSSDYFVKVYYKITNLEELMSWLDNHKTDPFKTKERVFNNSMVVYGEQLNIIDHRLIQFINDLMIENLPKLYRHLKYYIVVKDDKVIIINPDKYTESLIETDTVTDDVADKIDNDFDVSVDVSVNVSANTHNISIIRAYIKEKFLGSDNIHQFMSKIIRYYKEDIINRYVSDILVNHMIDYIIKRIKITIEQK